MYLLFSSFVPSHLHWWKVKNFMKVIKGGRMRVLIFLTFAMITDNVFGILLLCVHWFICFTHCWHLHWVLLEGTFVKQGWGKFFSLFTFDNYCVYSSIPSIFTKSWFITHFFHFYSQVYCYSKSLSIRSWGVTYYFQLSKLPWHGWEVLSLFVAI